MKKESLYDAFSVSDYAKDKIETVFSSRINNYIYEWNDAYRKRSEKLAAMGFSMSEEEMTAMVPFIPETIWEIINSVLENMRSGMSAIDALESADSARQYTPSSGPIYDLLDAFFEERPGAISWHLFLSGSNMAVKYNKFLSQTGLMRQFSAKDIDLVV